jgi:hypothetical protein
MKLTKFLKLAAASALLFSASVANAALYQFTLTGDYTASWQLNSSVTPDVVGPGEGFILQDVEGNFPGSLIDFVDLTFYSEAIGGGLEILDFYGDTLLLSTDGIQLYTGTEDFPSFILGTFALTEFQGTGVYSLTVSEVGAVAVPEPGSVFLLLGGIGAMAALRRRKGGAKRMTA